MTRDMTFPFLDARKEAFAQALARGLKQRAAAREAGYSDKGGRPYERAKSEEMNARVAQIVRTYAWSGTPDLAPVIDRLVSLVDALEKSGTAAAMTAAIRGLVEVARLKRMLPRPRLPREEEYEPELDEEAWLARFGSPQS